MSTILLTGAGGTALPDLIRHIKGLGHRVLTADMNPHAPGLYLGDGGIVVPPATDLEFGDVFYKLVKDHAVDVLIPLVDEELRSGLAVQAYTKVIVPDGRFTQTCLDKWALMHALELHRIKVPITTLFDGRFSPYYPTIIKPRTGRGSRGIHRFDYDSHLLQGLIDKKIRYSSDFLAQEYIEGTEYTVSVICDQNNTVHAVVPKEIILKEGQTKLAVTKRNDKIDSLCRRIAEVMHPCGPFNVQLRLRDGEPYVFEINPRFSGTVNLTIAAGCDEVGGLIELAMGRPYTFCEWQEGVVLVRQTSDAVMSEEDFNNRAPRRWDA